MGRGSNVRSYSYFDADKPIIEEAMKIAYGDGIKFAEYIVSLIKQDVNKYRASHPTKNEVGGGTAEEEVKEPETLEDGLTNLEIKPARISVKEFKKWNNRIQKSDNMGFLEKTANGFFELSQQCLQLSKNARSRAEFKRLNPLNSRTTIPSS